MTNAQTLLASVFANSPIDLEEPRIFEATYPSDSSSAFEHGFRAGRAEGLISLIDAVEQVLSPQLDIVPLEESPTLPYSTREPIDERLLSVRSKPCILLVDDEPINLDLLADTFGDDYEVLTAEEGQEAFDIAAYDMPDLILLDVVMPGMSGYELCKRLKMDHRTCDIPVIFITGLGDAEAETLGLKLGAVDYITKPINPASVRARVKNHIRLKQAQDKLVRLASLEQSLRKNLLEALESKTLLELNTEHD